MIEEYIRSLMKEYQKQYDFITDEVIERTVLKYNNYNQDNIKDAIEDNIQERLKKDIIEDNQKYTFATDFFNYKIEDNIMYSHLIPEELSSYMIFFRKKADGDIVKGFELYKEFIQSKVVEALDCAKELLLKNPDVKELRGSSSKLNDFHCGIFEDLGFVIGYYNDDQLSRLFPDATEEDKNKLRCYVYMSREDIINEEYKSKAPIAKTLSEKITNLGFVNNITLIIAGALILIGLGVYLAITIFNL